MFDLEQKTPSKGLQNLNYVRQVDRDRPASRYVGFHCKRKIVFFIF